MVKLDTNRAANEVAMSHSRDLVLTDNQWTARAEP
jgi:hypothetical protein